MLQNGYNLSADGREYTIIETIGRGANTVAYLAECTHSGLVTRCILKEYASNDEPSEQGKERFIRAGKMQNDIRQRTSLNNQTPSVSHIFEVSGTPYIDVACFGGATLNKLTELTLPQYMKICLTIAKTVGYYHKAGLLCLDLKPENIFILQNSPDDTVTDLVEFIDFDSVRDMAETAESTIISYTRAWAAPEQTAPFVAGRITQSADIYTVGELVFYLLFGRHSSDSEHRGFSKYSFYECRKEFRRFTDRPDIQSLFTQIFRGTLRSAASNRFGDIGEVVKLLGQLVYELERKDYVVPIFPSVSPDFVGRDSELKTIEESLQKNNVLYVTGIGGIGKTTLVRNYILQHKTDYDVIAYLEFENDFIHTFADDKQLQLSTLRYSDNENIDDYFERKLSHFKEICGNKRVLFVLDNFSGMVTKELSRIIDCGYDVIIVTRNKPPKNSFSFIEIGSISDTEELFRLIALDLERQPTKDERLCFDEMIQLVQGHTLVIELIARQIAAGRLDIHKALDLIRENGFSRFSTEKIGNYKDGIEVYDTLSAIITALFDASSMNGQELLTMKVLSLLDVRGLETDLVNNMLGITELSKLSAEGWLNADSRVQVHPVIAEALRNMEWSPEISDISVMEYHQKVVDIYVGMSNAPQICTILKEAEIYKNAHSRHFINAMYYDMIGYYYDTQLGGAYIPENDEEAELLEKLIDSCDLSVDEMEQSTDEQRDKFLEKYYISLAGVLIRSIPDFYDEAAELIKKAEELIEANEPQYAPERCYLLMVKAWYHTLVEPDLAETSQLTELAIRTAKQTFHTELEIIDIVYIPTANCFYYHDELGMAAEKLEEAVAICKQNAESFPYVDKQAELLNCMLDVYYAMGDKQKCRELIAEIDDINEKYSEQGICRTVSAELRKEIE